MATQETRGAEGPGNKVIATTLLEALAVRGRSVAAERAARALEAQGIELAAAPTWLADDAIPTLFAAAEVEVAQPLRCQIVAILLRLVQCLSQRVSAFQTALQ